MLSLTLTRALLPVSLGAVSAGLLATAGLGTGDHALRSGSGSGSYEARLTGAATTTLRGAVDLGRPAGYSSPGAFVITLGAYSDDGALVFSRWDGTQPEPGTYRITEEPTNDGLTALVVTGSPTRPQGAFRAQRGTLTITHSLREGLAGRFELEARGFGVTHPHREDREVTARGSFTASPPAPSAGIR